MVATCGWVMSSLVINSARHEGLGVVKEGAQGGEERGRLFNIWDMAAVLQPAGACGEGHGRGLRGGHRNGVILAMDDERGALQVSQGRDEVEVPERLPDGLLDAPGDPERGK